MKRLFPIAAMLLLPALAWGQQTPVTATITDPTGHPYAQGSGSASINCPGNQQPTYNGFTVPRNYTIVGLDGNGSFTLVLYDVNIISPSGCSYNFAITASNGSTSFTAPSIGLASSGTPVTGTNTVNLSAAISAYAVPLPSTGTGGIQSVTATTPVVSSGGLNPVVSCPTCVTGTGGAALTFPLTVAGAANSGGIPCFNSTTNMQSSAAFGAGVLPKGGGAGACPSASLLSDNGTTATYTGTGGVSTPSVQATNSVNTGSGTTVCGSATACWGAAEAATGATPTAGQDSMRPDTSHTYKCSMNGASEPSCAFAALNLLPTYAGLTGAGLTFPTILATLDQTGISTANSGSPQNILASTPAAGHYTGHIYIDQSAGCATLGLGAFTAVINWTDATHARVSATQTLTVATADTGTGDFIDFPFGFWAANATAVTVTATYTACTTGTWTYDLHAWVAETK